jgi:hypothetical protein
MQRLNPEEAGGGPSAPSGRAGSVDDRGKAPSAAVASLGLKSDRPGDEEGVLGQSVSRACPQAAGGAHRGTDLVNARGIAVPMVLTGRLPQLPGASEAPLHEERH